MASTFPQNTTGQLYVNGLMIVMMSVMNSVGDTLIALYHRYRDDVGHTVSRWLIFCPASLRWVYTACAGRWWPIPFLQPSYSSSISSPEDGSAKRCSLSLLLLSHFPLPGVGEE